MSRAAPPGGAVVFLMGPTAAGKTGLAVELVRRLPFEIISVDSALVYRGMDIGTAKPRPEILARAPHRLIDIRDPAESYSAAEFRRDARREIQAVLASGRIPLLVGGTMLYFQALQSGLSRLPAADPEVRARLEAEAAARGWAALHGRLAAIDPQAAARIHPNDPQRIQRALEVFELTGTPISALHGQRAGGELDCRVVKIGLVPAERERLHARIEARFGEMLEAGLIEEVQALRARGDLDPRMSSMRCVGYRQVWEHLEGRYDRETLLRHGCAASRQLAKRQLTWLRAERGLRALDCFGADLAAAAAGEIEAALGTTA